MQALADAQAWGSGGVSTPAKSTSVSRERRVSTTPRLVAVSTCAFQHGVPLVTDRALTASLVQLDYVAAKMHLAAYITCTTAVKMECERLDSEFSSVAATVRFSAPRCMSARTCAAAGTAGKQCVRW